MDQQPIATTPLVHFADYIELFEQCRLWDMNLEFQAIYSWHEEVNNHTAEVARGPSP